MASSIVCGVQQHSRAAAAMTRLVLRRRRQQASRCVRLLTSDRRAVAKVVLLALSAALALHYLYLKSCGRQSRDTTVAPATAASDKVAPNRRVGRSGLTIGKARRQSLAGVLLPPTPSTAGAFGTAASMTSGHNRTTPDVVEHNVTLSVVVAFSPSIEEHAKHMFEDKFSECRFHAMGPAMAAWRGEVVACVRLFLSQYLLALGNVQMPSPIDTWQENYVYAMRLRPDDYALVEDGRLLGIPTPTNAKLRYRKDGPMDPRAFVYKGRLFLIYYSYSAPGPKVTARCRMYFWDYERSVKKIISVAGIVLHDPDINWSPLVVGGNTLYLVYALDPLRMLLCDPDTGRCALCCDHTGADRITRHRSAGALRGGTPFVEYAHPYYFGVAHSKVWVQRLQKAVYAAHLVIIRVDPWRLVYVSGRVEADEQWLSEKPLIPSSYVATSFWYPTALLRRDEDVYDIGCHVNDHSSYVFRLVGLKRLFADAVARDATTLAASGADSEASLPVRQSPPQGLAERFVIDDCHNRFGD